MTLNKILVNKFQTLHLEKFGEALSYDIAEHQLQELADLVRLIASPEKDGTNAQITHG